MLLLARSGLGYLDSATLRATFVPPGAGCRFCAGSHGWGLGLSDWLPCLGVCELTGKAKTSTMDFMIICTQRLAFVSRML